MKTKTLLIIPLIALTVSCTNPSAPAGYEGYVYENPRVWGKGGFQGELKGPGNFGVSLWRNQVINIDIRPKTYTEHFKILAKDDLNISFNYHAIISVKADSIRAVVEQYGGKNWYKRFVLEPFRTFARNSVQRYTAIDLKTKRDEMSAEVFKQLKDYLKGSPFVLKSLVVGNITYPSVVADAVEKKLAAQQLLAEKSTQKEIAKKDAEIRVEEAKGIAQAQKIINATLTTNYLQHEAIQTQLKMADSPNHTTVYIPVGANGIPIMKTVK
ncbi:MAG TPA: hypothetical protein ENJ60_03315 [Aeromonadales bacterium]|nr:hypothetical protein [Aeromonadales bacterium]